MAQPEESREKTAKVDDVLLHGMKEDTPRWKKGKPPPDQRQADRDQPEESTESEC
jgi:hypothetical protein